MQINRGMLRVRQVKASYKQHFLAIPQSVENQRIANMENAL
jgi:hypothetical protein